MSKKTEFKAEEVVCWKVTADIIYGGMGKEREFNIITACGDPPTYTQVSECFYRLQFLDEKARKEIGVKITKIERERPTLMPHDELLEI